MKSLTIPLRQFSSVKLFLLLFTLAIFTSCQKNIETPEMNEGVVFPTSDKDVARVALFKEVSDILFEVYQNPKAYYEVNAAILSEYYADERVLLKDLLLPEYSKLYRSEKFKSFKAFTGEFKKEFYSVLSDKESPVLRQALNLPSLQESLNSRFSAIAPTDTAMEIFSNSNGVSIYFPYSENFGSNFTPAYFDNINDSPYGDFATIVIAHREADSGSGREPYRCGTRDNQSVCFRAKTVNDDYAEIHETHIVGVGAEPFIYNPNILQIFPPGAPIDLPNLPREVKQVYIGEFKINGHQFDKFISLSGNGGGSEIRFTRADGFLKVVDGQVTLADVYFTPTIHVKRKKIRKKNWIDATLEWDGDWELANFNQNLAIYEEDNRNTSEFSAGLTTTITVPIPGTTPTINTQIAGNIGFKIIFKSDDELIRQINLKRDVFFILNATNLEGEMRNGWPVRDKNGILSYTLADRTYF